MGRALTLLLALYLFVPAARAADDFAVAVGDSVDYLATIPLALTLGGGEHEEHIGRTMADAYFVTFCSARILKYMTNEDRPESPGATDGFPSGHAAIAFALAESASALDRDVRPYAYAWAAGVGWSRVKTDQHSGWQVAAGAALGYAIGHASARSDGGLFFGLLADDRPTNPGSHLMLRPTYDVDIDDPTALRVKVWEASW